MSSYTKGQWKTRIDGTSSGRWIEVYVEGEYYDDGSEFVVAETGTVESRIASRGRFIRTDEAPTIEANAKLIACTPEMAEMLRGKVLAALTQPQAMDIEGVIEDIRELLKKAGVIE